jgi:hypothetical protein
MGIFILPFLMVGVVMMGLTVYQFLSLSNPKAELTIKPGVPMLGGPLDSSRLEFTLSPTGEEILLHAHARPR